MPFILKSDKINELKRRGYETMSIGNVVLILLILFLVGALPAWPYSQSWGYYPSGGAGLLLLILIILLVTGRL